MSYDKITSDAILRILENRFRGLVEDIASGNCRIHFLAKQRTVTDAELVAYVEGVETVLIAALESLQDNTDAPDANCLLVSNDAGKWMDQLRGALGEQLRRRHPGERACMGRKLNEWLCEIRDRRIALEDNYESKDFSDWAYKLGREMEKWDQKTVLQTECYDTLRTIRCELSGLKAHHDYLHTCQDWTDKRFEHLKKSAVNTV